MRLISIDIENFLSIEKAHIDFDDSGRLLLEGWNYDVDRANGAGKTAILNGISFGLYDKLPRKITSTELLRRGTKKGLIAISLDTGSEILVVRRSRPKGVKFYRQLNGTFDELKITQEEWESKLKLSYNQFIVSMYCSQANSSIAPRFLLLNDTDKKQFLLQLLNLDHFALCKKITDDKINQIILNSQNNQNKISELQVKINAFSESLIDENEIHLTIAQKEDTKKKFLKALQDNQLVVKPDLAKYHQLEEDILHKKTEFVKMRATRDMLFTQFTSIAKKVKPFNSSSSCPTCGNKIDNSHAKSFHDSEMTKLKEEQVVLKKQMDDIDLSNESKIDELYSKLRDRKRKESAAYEKASLDGVELKAKLNMLSVEIREGNDKLLKNKQLSERIKGFSEQKEILKAELDTLSADLEMQKTVSAIYSPTGAQAYVLDSAVALFNEKMAVYVGELWPNLTYELQSYKENVRGEVVAKFSEAIIMDGKSISLGSLSGGELKALSICADMALLGILEQQFGISMSPIIFDEAFDGLDAAGKEFALDLIGVLSKDRQVIVIDHASEMRALFDKTLRVEKRNGISSIINT